MEHALKWGLVFGGGGGKGAYQIGVWQALQKIGIDGDVVGVSGASVGALNAALFAAGNLDMAKEAWLQVTPEEFLSLNHLDSLLEGLFSRDGLIKIMDNYLNFSDVATSSILTYVNMTLCQSSETQEIHISSLQDALVNYLCDLSTASTVYRRLNNASESDIRTWLLASSALPYAYEPVIIDGQEYRDGGILDNIPVKPLVDAGLKNLIIVKLEPDENIPTELLSQASHTIILSPSQEIGDFFDGTIDFHSYDVPFRILLGYYDTLRAFHIFSLEMQGIPVSQEDRELWAARDGQHILLELTKEP